MSPAELVDRLRALGIDLWVEGGRLQYEAPSGALTPALRRELGERKAEVLAFVHDAQTLEKRALPPIRRTALEQALPLGLAQQQLWFLAEIDPGSTEYNIVRSFRLTGRLDVPALEHSLKEILRRHEALRTSFETLDGEPVQRVVEARGWQISQIDLSALPQAQREQAARDLGARAYDTPFDLAEAPLVRAQLARLSPDVHVLVLSLHHIVCDGWSVGVLLKELSSLYGTYSTGRRSTLAELPLQYRDFAAWQREAAKSDAFDIQRRYWCERLADVSALELPTDRPRPSTRTTRGARERLDLPAALTDACECLAREHRCTTFMVLLAAYAVLLHRYTRVDDVVIGAPVANRSHPELAELIGFFANTLALRVDLGGDPRFAELLARVRALTLQAQAHQDLPFETVVRELAPDRDLSRNPLFQVMLAYQSTPSRELELTGLSVAPMEIDNTSAKFDLLLDVQVGAGRLDGFLEYNAALFDQASAVRMAAHMRNVLSAAIRQPELRISALPLMEAGERNGVLHDWNRTGTDPGVVETVTSLFELQVERTPEADAVEHAGERLTYRALNARANRLARKLQHRGVGPDVLVGICLAPSVEMVLAVLAVLKAGGGYVPMDPDYPAARLAQMLEDSEPAAILTLAGQSLPRTDVPVLALDLDEEVPDPDAEANLEASPGAHDIAYVIFTSGSTGRPKGAAMEHRALGNLVRWQLEHFTAPRDARTLQLTSLSFDVSFQEIFCTWCGGGTLVVAQSGVRRDPRALLRTLDAAAVERVFLPFTALQQLAEAARGEVVPGGLREVVTAGERLRITPAIVALMNRLDDGVLHNQYGPSETHVVTSLTLHGNAERWPPLPSIGTPISCVRVHVLDTRLEPAPIGVPGELFIAGVALGRGYLGRDELSRERFIPDPHDQTPGARLYRTGDLARRLPDGTIEFLGRYDDQVKLRGFRIELGEVETVLGEHPDLRECAALVREDEPGEGHLVAYVVPRERPGPDATAMRAFLRQRLPEFMVPSRFVTLDDLPLTPSGKVNRRALPAPTGERSLREASVPPRTPLEHRIADLWRSVLRVDRVGVHDNFFDLGGHSLLATRLRSRLRDRLGVELTLADLFAHATVAGMATLLEEASNGDVGRSESPIPLAGRDSPLPLSFAQERMWLIDQMVAEDNPAYHLALPIELRGRLDVDVMRMALQAIVERHEPLRTVLEPTADGARQRVVENLSLEVPIEDFSSATPAERDARLRQHIDEEGARPFDLTIGPMVRARLLRLDPERHALLLTLHHIVADGWSLDVLFEEIGALYRAGCDGEETTLDPLPLQYADFAAWQREWMSGARLKREIAHWTKALEGLATLELPTDKRRPSRQSYAGARETARLPAELRLSLERLARHEGATLFMALLAAFMALLHRYSGQEDIVVGSPIAGRNRAELEGLVGFFVNMLVLRTRVDGNTSFTDLLSRVRRTALTAYEHQDLPFEKLVEAMDPARDPSRNALFQVIFALQSAPMAPLESLRLPGLNLSLFPRATQSTRFDLEVHAWQDPDGLELGFVYNTDLFEAATIRRMLAHYRRLLEAVVATPERPVGELALLTEAEREQVLAQWNASDVDYPREASIEELFERQARATPEAVALEFEGKRLSYAELNRRANRLAHHLRGLGVGHETRVGVCLQRSLEMVVAVLGIVKAGGAYVPLDPDYPPARLAFMLTDSAAPVLLTQAALLERLPATEADVVCLDRDWARIETERKHNPEPLCGARSLAYLIYTSGSTGVPKGTCIEHRSVVRLVKSANYLEMGPEEVWLQFAPISFDASTLELWGSLLNGARLVVFPPHIPTFEELAHFLTEQRISVLWLTAALFHRMVDEQPEALAGVRQLLAGGETLSLAHVKRLLARLPPGGRLINGYGPTENTTFTCCHVMHAGEDIGPSVPIGRPISNTSVYVLDAHRAPVPVGVQGELYIGGDGLAREYWRRPELSAEKFVPHPFSDEPGARLYRTGDRVRWRDDGVLEFLGRLDHQLKVRGFRIEPGEVEVVLGQHEAVRQSVVVCREDEPQDKRLVAYVVPHGDDPRPDTLVPALRAHLKALLPPYMVPAAFVVLDQLPISPNGKLDRSALPEPEYARDTDAVAPRNPIEEVIATIWSEVLAVERVGVHDDFFELGGHSLLATQVVSRVREALSVELSLVELFDHATVAGIASLVEAAGEAPADAPGPIPHADRAQSLPLSFAQERLWIIDRMLPGNAPYHVPMGFELRGELDVAALRHALDAIVERHEVLRTVFEASEAGPRQVVLAPWQPALRPERARDLPAPERAAWVAEQVREEATLPFDLARGPLLRARLLALEPDRHVLLLTAHHIVSDGWSIGVLFRELGELYEAFRAGRPSPLEPLPVQYADFAVWQHEWMSGDRLECEIAHWTRALKGLTTLALPTDKRRPSRQGHAGARETTRLPAELRLSLERLARREGTTLFMAMLAAFVALLHRYSVQNDIVVGSPIAGRNRAELENLIGFFVNMLVLRTEVDGDASFTDLLARVRGTALEAYEHQDLPFEKLVEALEPARDPSRNPLFQVMFALQNAPMDGLTLPDLNLSMLQSDAYATRFDLEVHAWPQSEGLVVGFAYNTDLFEASTIRRMLAHYRRLLEAAVAAPERALSAVNLLSNAEREQLLKQWNATAVDCPPEETVIDLFEAQVDRRPDDEAVLFGRQSMSYAQLDARANALAAHLQGLGAGPESLVGICLEPCVELALAVLGVLKAGAGYVPLDPGYPAARLAQMVDDVEPAVILTRVGQDLPEHHAVVVDMDDPQGPWHVGADTRPVRAAAPSSVAYVIFTSGSTGRPKGTVLEHRSLVNLIRWQIDNFATRVNARTLQFTSLSFDVSFQEIFSTWCAGGALVMMPAEMRRDPAAMLRTMKDAKVERLFLPFAALQLFAECAQRFGPPATLREIMTAGEQLQVTPAVESLMRQLNGGVLHNQYGPTEASVIVAALTLEGAPEDWPRLPPIGWPISNVSLHVLDRRGEPQPVGVPGELHIGGACLARGYLKRPELTEEKFIPDHYSDRAGARLYRTGDLARRLPDGAIEYLGRMDRQVKVRGFRIELGEIEAVLGEHPEVRQTVVLCREDTPGDKRIVAYVVTSDPEADETALWTTLRAHTRAKLPYYMVPSAFMHLDALPLTQSQKVDRMALPEPGDARLGLAAAPVAPRSDLEARLVDVWRRSLKVEEVSIDDNFFDLGGNSMLLVRCHEELCSELERRIPVIDMFQHPSIRSLVEHCVEGGVSSKAIQIDNERADRQRRALRGPPNTRSRRSSP